MHELPWVFDYKEDLTVGAEERIPRTGRVPLRPAVEVSITGPKGPAKTWGLIDSGSEHTIAGPWMSRASGCVPAHDALELVIGIGGRPRTVRFTTVTLMLHPPIPDSEQDPIYWDAEVGFLEQWKPPWQVLLGQVRFFDRFTVVMNRSAGQLAVQDLDAWDDLVPQGPGQQSRPELDRPRFSP